MSLRKMMAVTAISTLLLPLFVVPSSALDGNATGAYLQIVAHADDDILFMNPDVQTTVAAGRPITTVFLTAGEASLAPGSRDGVDDADCADGDVENDGQVVALSREQYADCRMRGARAAWATMADRPDSWDYGSRVEAGKQVEVDTLRGAGPAVTLIWLSLPEHADGHDTRANQGDGTPDIASLYFLWTTQTIRKSILPATGEVDERQEYGREDLLRVLSGLINAYGATVVRVQDNEPDDRTVAFKNPDWLDDHSDHVVTAWFVAEATARAGGVRRVVNYRSYNVAEAQVNLDPDEHARKQEIFGAYLPFDHGASADWPYDHWTNRQYHRWWAGTKWVDRNLDGRLQTFAVVNGRARTWWQAPGGAWQGPVELGDPGGRLAPGVTVSRNVDGRLQIFALRLTDWQIVTTYQTEANGGWAGCWVSLGNPNAGGGAKERQIGQPVVTTNQDGRIQVFVKNGGGGISTTYQTAPNAGFSGWTDLGGTGVQDGLAVTTNDDGRIELFAYAINNGLGSIHHRYQPAPNVGFDTNPNFAVVEPAGPPTVATNKDGRLDVFYRTATNDQGANAGKVAHTWQTQKGGGWTTTPQLVNGHGGTGPVAVANAPHGRDGVTGVDDARIMVFERNRGGGISMIRQDGPDNGFSGPWVDTGGYVATEPAVTSDFFGHMFAFAIAGDGRLLVNNQVGPGGGAGFTGWRAVG